MASKVNIHLKVLGQIPSFTSSIFTLTTDKANHQALKAVLASISTGNSESPLFMTFCGAQAYPKLPFVSSTTFKHNLFDTNEMVSLLLKKEASLTDAQWMEWEALHFTSAIAPLYKSRNLTPQALEVFRHLEKHLVQSESFMNSTSSPTALEATNIVLFCALLPALCEEGLLPDVHRSEFPRLVQWYNTFHKVNRSLLLQAYSQLGVQEEGDFLRVRRVFRMKPSPAKPFYVTTPIYYVNAAPHIGHVYTSLIADCLARYHEIKGESTFCCTGTDEHGQKVAQAAEKHGKTPYEYCTTVAGEFRTCFEKMKLKYDYFIRTTDKNHEQNASELWRKLEAEGYIYKGDYEGWYCVSDENFVTQQYVVDGFHPLTKEPCKVSTESGNPVIWIAEENYYFKLSAFQDRLLKFYEENPTFVVPEFRRQEVIRLVSKGMPDLSISRKKKSCSWGVPIPGTDEHVMYVWLDALSNYYTASRLNKAGELRPYQENNLWPCDIHVVGKDILKFHAIYWPAFLMGAGLPLPKQVVAHGWWTKDKMKISKSLGNTFDPVEKADDFGLDSLRYFLLRESSFADDPDYSDRTMIARLNGELADCLGNLVLRCVSRKLNLKEQWPAFDIKGITPGDELIIQHLKELPGTADHFYLIPDIQRALIAIFEFLREVNLYLTENEPWKMTKTKEGKEDLPREKWCVIGDENRLNQVLYITLESTRIAALLLFPVMPEICSKILDQLGVPGAHRSGLKALDFGVVPSGTPLGPVSSEILFPKHEQKIVVPQKRERSPKRKQEKK